MSKTKDAAAKDGKARDPICGMSVTIATAKHKAECDGHEFYFCSGGCKTRFQADPGHYLAIRKRDPVCGMEVSAVLTPHYAQSGKKSYFFCSAGCQTKFEADPGRYTGDKPAPPPAPVDEGAIFTCPMHPEVVQDHPGACPKCGMALEPQTLVPEAEEDDSELRDMTRRFR